MNPELTPDPSVEGQSTPPVEGAPVTPVEGQPVVPEQKGGPSDEFKMKRLEEEKAQAESKLKEFEERTAAIEAAERASKEQGMSEDEKFEAKQHDFYKRTTGNQIKTELGEAFNTLPKRVKKAIESDPITLGNALDSKAIDYAVRATGSNELEDQYAASAKVISNLIREEFAPNTPAVNNAPADGNQPMGVNPPIEGKDLNQPRNMTMAERMSLSDDELERLAEQERRMRGI